MKRNVIFTVCVVLLMMIFGGLATVSAQSTAPAAKTLREAALNGPSIQVDPGFPYYQGRTPESIADEISLAGYGAVHYFVVNEKVVDRALINAFHERGIAVWALVLGNGTYSTAGYPPEWRDWRTVQISAPADGFTHFSLHSDEFREWKKEALVKLVTDYPFDGIELAEPYLPSWLGLQNGTYGDVGPHAARAFQEQYGKQMPDFTDPQSPRYYLNDKDTYEDWVQFRVDAVNSFGDDVINGPGGVKEARPDILVATWSLAIDAGPDSVSQLRERQGIHAPSMVSQIKPDIHFFQTHWPDWVKPQLPGDYPLAYAPFVEQLRAVHPDIPIGIQADIGSQQAMRRGHEWLDLFVDTVDELGFQTWTAYEYHLGEYMYTEPPVPLTVSKGGPGWLIVSFNKRIAPASALKNNVTFQLGDERVTVDMIHVDGNRLFVQSRRFPEAPFELEIEGIEDTPALWLFKNFPANKVVPHTRITVPQ